MHASITNCYSLYYLTKRCWEPKKSRKTFLFLESRKFYWDFKWEYIIPRLPWYTHLPRFSNSNFRPTLVRNSAFKLHDYDYSKSVVFRRQACSPCTQSLIRCSILSLLFKTDNIAVIFQYRKSEFWIIFRTIFMQLSSEIF